MHPKTIFKDCKITNKGYEFNGIVFHNFVDFARYVETHEGRIWYKSGDIIKVRVKEE